MRNSTLSRKLFIRIVPTIIAVILLVGALAFYSANTEINTVYDAQLANNANVLWVLVSDDVYDPESATPKEVADIDLSFGHHLASNKSADEYAGARMFRVWKEGKLMMYSNTVPAAHIPRLSEGFLTIRIKNEAWRFYTLLVPGEPISVEVGEKIHLRDMLAANILFNLAVPLLLLVPLIGMLIWFGIGSGLGIVRNLVEEIHKRTPDDLSHINIEHLPDDLMPLGKSLNQLFGQLEHSFNAEKRFTDHAAHQLRTPLAAIKLQLQMLAGATSEEERQGLIRELLLSNDRTTKLVGSLLTSARVSHQPMHLHNVALYPVVASVMAQMGLLAKTKHIEMSLAGAEDAYVLADEVLLTLLLSNVIDNAIKYTPENGVVSVHLEQLQQGCRISVSDTGVGIPPEERAHAFERFYRVNSPAVEGSGLGLSIAAEIIERFSGTIELKDTALGTGLLVEIVIPSK